MAETLRFGPMHLAGLGGALAEASPRVNSETSGTKKLQRPPGAQARAVLGEDFVLVLS